MLSYSVISEKHVPTRISRKINKATISMIENGLHKFYRSFGQFLIRLYGRKVFDHKNDELPLLTMRHMIVPFTMLSGLLGVSFIVLFIEIIVFNWNKRRSLRAKVNRP